MADTSKKSFLAPWSLVNQGLQQFYPQIFDLWNQGPGAPLSPEQQVAGLTPQQQQAMAQMAQWGQGTGGQIQDFATGQLGAGLDMGQVAQYADNPYLDDQITAALRDPYRQLTEQTLPGMDVMQAATGNTDSVRADMAEAVAQRGYADRASDVAANMRGAAYGRGLNTALSTRNQDIDFARLGQDIGLGNIDTLLQSGGLGQFQNQKLADAGMRNWQYNQGAPWNWAESYSNLVSPPAVSFGEKFGPDTSADFMDVLLGSLTSGAIKGAQGPLQDLFGQYAQRGVSAIDDFLDGIFG
jgi:hypothetical protein